MPPVRPLVDVSVMLSVRPPVDVGVCWTVVWSSRHNRTNESMHRTNVLLVYSLSIIVYFI
jgi:hypothetical protein